MNEILSNSTVFIPITINEKSQSYAQYTKDIRNLCRGKTITTEDLKSFLENIKSTAYIYGQPKTHKPENVRLFPCLISHQLKTSEFLRDWQQTHPTSSIDEIWHKEGFKSKWKPPPAAPVDKRSPSTGIPAGTCLPTIPTRQVPEEVDGQRGEGAPAPLEEFFLGPKGGRIVVYRDCGLSYCGIAARVCRGLMTVKEYGIEGFRAVIRNDVLDLTGPLSVTTQKTKMSPTWLNGSYNHGKSPESIIRVVCKSKVSARSSTTLAWTVSSATMASVTWCDQRRT
ncbi:hypothetical protein LAZ67_X004212 [Cordylochernes scorpioides]|uniref:Uncharacterized protein n=1 Tax=Cordylochernes scorpioides TaxID=51811 RepID=A0ABY6LVS8_9ARAC|nr:hypothetical protein LAZ67_X004212 [Cordylochernes scorpioides]